MKVGIAPKIADNRALQLAAELAQWLLDHSHEVILSEICLKDRTGLPHKSLTDMAESVELMVVLGGDGTMLHVARSFIGSPVPIMGINAGHLGFLTVAPIMDMFKAVEQVLAGKSRVERRFSLRVEVWRGDRQMGSGFALNDVVLHRNSHPRAIEFEMRVHGQFVFRLCGDGLILSTPAGSTAYALSAGGPILHSRLPAISVVPICPHILSNRPVVVPAEDTIELKVTGSTIPVALSLDGQTHSSLQQGDLIQVEKAGYVSFVYLTSRNYYQVLNSKLHWGGPTKQEHAG